MTPFMGTEVCIQLLKMSMQIKQWLKEAKRGKRLTDESEVSEAHHDDGVVWRWVTRTGQKRFCAMTWGIREERDCTSRNLLFPSLRNEADTLQTSQKPLTTSQPSPSSASSPSAREPWEKPPSELPSETGSLFDQSERVPEGPRPRHLLRKQRRGILLGSIRLGVFTGISDAHRQCDFNPLRILGTDRMRMRIWHIDQVSRASDIPA